MKMIKQKKYSVIIAAAGKSSRMNTHTNKTLLEINGLPILEINIKQWLTKTEISEIIITYNDDVHENYKKIIAKYDTANIKLVKGGKDRKDSILNGLLAVNKDVSHVIVHDGARPFLSKTCYAKINQALQTNDIVVTYQKTVDTSYYKSENSIKHIDRDKIYRALTPQCFSYPIVKKIIECLNKNEKNYTDEISIILELGLTPKFIEADKTLFKITEKFDYELARFTYNYLLENNLCE